MEVHPASSSDLLRLRWSQKLSPGVLCLAPGRDPSVGTRCNANVVPVWIDQSKVRRTPRLVHWWLDLAVVTCRFAVSQSVGRVDVVDLDDDLETDAPWPGQTRRGEVVIIGQICVSLNPYRDHSGVHGNVVLWRPLRGRRKPECRLVEVHGLLDIIDE